MPRHSAVLLLLFCLAPLTYGQKYRLGERPTNQNPADYTIKVHISGIHFRACATVSAHSECQAGLYADATLDGKKVELFTASDDKDLKRIVPGDYLARLYSSKPRYEGKAVLFQWYWLLLPDKSASEFEITGLSE